MRKRNIILGISPGTRYVGYAVMIDGELVDWGLKSFKGKWSNKKKSQILSSIQAIVARYFLQKINVKVINKHYRTGGYNALLDEIRLIADENPVKISFFSRSQIHPLSLLQGNTGANWTNLDEKVKEAMVIAAAGK